MTLLLIPGALALAPPCGLVGWQCCSWEPACTTTGRPVQCTNGQCEFCANVGEPICRGDYGPGGDFCAPELEPDAAGICICPRDFGAVPCVSNTCRPGLEVGADGLCAGIGGCGEEGAACCDTAPGFECRNLLGTTADGRGGRRPLQCSASGVCEACGKEGLPTCTDSNGAAYCEGRFVVVGGMCELCGAAGEAACEAPWQACDEGLVEENGLCVEPNARPCGGRLQDCCSGKKCHGGLKCFKRFVSRPQGLCVTKFRGRSGEVE